jgi:hypothetical protein
MFGVNSFGLPLSQGVLKTLSAESVQVFQGQGGQQQGQGGGQGSGGASSASCFNISSSNITSLSEKYSSSNYRLYQYTRYDNNKFYIISWDSASAPTSFQKGNFIKSIRGRSSSAGNSCINPSNPGFTQLYEGDRFNTNLNMNKWKEYKAAHESANAGCTDSSNPNYNSSALTMDNSCAWVESRGTKYTKNSAQATDKVRFEGAITEESRPILNGSEYRFKGIIKRVCVGSCCEKEDGTKESTIINSFDSPIITLTTRDNSAYYTALDSLKKKIDNSVKSASISWNPVVSTQRNSNTYKTLTACDGTIFTIERVVKTSKCGGNTVEVIYNFTKGGSIVKTEIWTESTGITTSKFRATIPIDPQGRAGHGGIVDYLRYILEAHEAALPIKSSGFDVQKSSVTNIGVIGSDTQQMLLVGYQRTPYKIDGCDKKKQAGDTEYYMNSYVYDYSPTNQIIPTYDGITLEIITVTYDGSVIQPTNVYGPFTDKPTIESLGLKVIRGCMDTTANNYDATANTDDGCKYTCADSNRTTIADGSCNVDCKSGYIFDSNNLCVPESGDIDTETELGTNWLPFAGIGAIILFAVLG